MLFDFEIKNTHRKQITNHLEHCHLVLWSDYHLVVEAITSLGCLVYINMEHCKQGILKQW